MTELEMLRGELDQVDRELVRLFEKRMGLCRAVARYKLERDMPVLDRSREAQVLASRCAMLADPCWTDATRALFEAIMALSRAEQQACMEEARGQ